MSDILSEGKALTLASHALEALDDADVDFESANREGRRTFLRTYRNSLREILATVTPEQAAAIMAVAPGMKGPMVQAEAN